ncbi:MAG: TRAP transporter substrate-binding protein [Peptococcales bacterium]|jgi:TRAP-type mannitol/chloroaromatic compound transport system substrate-binding protein
MKKGLAILLVLSLMFFMFGCTSKPAPQPEPKQTTTEPKVEEKVYKFRLQSVNPASSMYFAMLQDFADSLNKMSGGRLQAEVLPDGAIVPAFELLDAVSDGILEAGNGWTNYWSGKHPASTLFGAPPAGAGTGMDQTAHLSWFYNGGGQELATEFYQDILGADVVPFLIIPAGPDPMGWFKEEIRTYDDIKKIKFRTPPGIPGEIYSRIGISAVSLPGGEIVPSAQKGVIDAAEWIGPAEDRAIGLYDVWKHYYLQGLHQSTDCGDFFISKKFYDSLPTDLQAIMTEAIMSTQYKTILTNTSENGKALYEYTNNHGVTVHDTPPELYEEYLKVAQEIMDEYAAKDAFFKKVLDSQREFASTTVPYQVEVFKLYSYLGQTALE